MKKILIIDDSAFMRNILKEILQGDENGLSLREPVEIYEADGKIHGVEQMEIVQPDLILLDVVMRESEKEGVEFVELIHKNFDTGKIIIISSIGQSSIFDSLRELGVKYYLQKPFEFKEVIETVNNVLF